MLKMLQLSIKFIRQKCKINRYSHSNRTRFNELFFFTPSIIDLQLILIMPSKSLLLALTLVLVAHAAVDSDIVKPVPGYPADFKQRVWSGYLNTASPSRKLHYVLIQSSSTQKDIPLTLWLNGGPGCSSLLGYLQEIGPFYLEEGIRYKVGDQLYQNEYSWHQKSHLLFLESPAGVGYSINSDDSFSYNDETTATDGLSALTDFFAKYPEYAPNNFWIAGQSYAGKYIPDLAVKIDIYNTQQKAKAINLKGILVGNGVMSFENGQLQKNSMEFMINHEFIDPDLMPYYRGSCMIDADSAGCKYFKRRYEINVDQINPYNVYSYCYYNDSFMTSPKENKHSQDSILKNIIANNGTFNKQAGNNGAPCAYFDGLVDYFNAHAKDYHAADGMKWNGPCADNVTGVYHISLRGSMAEYRYLLDRLDKYHIVLYNGDWDDVVPYTDTFSNIEKLRLDPSYIYTPFFANGQHAGWTQIFGGILYVQVKGASHQVPQSKRPEAFELFKMALEGHNSQSTM